MNFAVIKYKEHRQRKGIPVIGKRIEAYHVVEAVGRGSISTVYRAQQTTTGANVVVKVLDSPQDVETLQKFGATLDAVMTLDHDHIVRVFEHNLHHPTPYLLTQYLICAPLSEVLDHTYLSLPDAVVVARGVAAALDYAHGRGVIHGDVQPANILLDIAGGVFLSDFGVRQLTRVDLAGGTLAYTAPEQAVDRPYDHRSDIYGLGVVLFHALTGHLPYEGDTGVELAVKHIRQPVPPVTAYHPHLPESVDEAIARALAKQPEHRYADASALAEALASTLEDPQTVQTFSDALMALVDHLARRPREATPPSINPVDEDIERPTTLRLNLAQPPPVGSSWSGLVMLLVLLILVVSIGVMILALAASIDLG